MSRRRARRSQVDARESRKFERATRHTHSVAPGPSIIEILEQRLDEMARRYVLFRESLREIEDSDEEYTVYEWVDVKAKRAKDEAMLRGELRGVAISIAMMRHPLRRYETAWWGYVKKLEKRAVSNARAQIDDN